MNKTQYKKNLCDNSDINLGVIRNSTGWYIGDFLERARHVASYPAGLVGTARIERNLRCKGGQERDLQTKYQPDDGR